MSAEIVNIRGFKPKGETEHLLRGKNGDVLLASVKTAGLPTVQPIYHYTLSEFVAPEQDPA